MLSDHVYLMKGSRAYYTNVVYMFTSSLPLLFCLGYEEDGDGVGALDLGTEQGSESSWPSPIRARPSIHQQTRISTQVSSESGYHQVNYW